VSTRDASPRLGRGLAALLGEPAAAAAAPRALSVGQLEPGPFQPRQTMRPEPMAELVESIRLRGVLQPILARPHPNERDRFQIIAGERRWRATQAAGLHEIPVLVRDLSDADAMAAALVENLQRQDLDPIEEAEGYRRLLHEFGLTQEKLGDAVGKSRSHVANAMRLLQLPAPVRAELQKGTLSAGHARALLTHPEPEKAALTVIARGLNVRQTEDLARRRSAPPRHRVADRSDEPETQAVARDLTERLGLKVDISFDGTGGQLRIRYSSLDQLDGLITLLTRS
jgi:ParB family transcriptional regulator, chromosome partitioning protein